MKLQSWKKPAKIVFGVLVLLWLFSSGKLDLGLLLTAPSTSGHLCGLILLLIMLLLQVYRWQLLLESQRIHLGFLTACRLTWVSQFITVFTPGVVGGEIVRGYQLTRNISERKAGGASTVIIDRVLGLYAQVVFGLISFLSLLVTEQHLPAPVLQMGWVLMAVLGAIHALPLLRYNGIKRLCRFFFKEKTFAVFEDVWLHYHRNPAILAKGIALSFGAALFSLSAFTLAARLFVPGLNWNIVFMVAPLVFIVVTLPLSPGGIGVGEASAAVLFTAFGIEAGATIMMLYRLWLLLLKLPGGFMLIADLQNNKV
ncbi:lysylphosphatidylglycerol synthase transmembrane domain-containing protein [uncultured Desulfuromonas sp.]|uniref:lysylphosphatidylglycerol synthase transmembrane domain-containing protein n=1 Tax=uncultured Desulfuromonas sp. TaxID=181013 RepID=UPI002AAB5BAD|nr:lysylphosphatidylglycerol synthase transmembrane domain-containing protein [uncultured Desulfuromonas sp.]